MRVRILKDEGAVARSVASQVAALIAERPDAVLGLPTGRTPIGLYAELRERHAAGEIDFSRVRTFNLDEFLGLPSNHPASYRTFMDTHLFRHVNLPRRYIHFLNGMAADAEAECRRYEAAIAAAGGLDLALLGVGVDGHVAYNMPGPISLPTHVTRLPDGLAASLHVPEASWPLRAVTMGIGTIRGARAIRVIATGARKATAVRMLVHGPENPDWPCSFLQSHPDIEVLMDPPAATAL